MRFFVITLILLVGASGVSAQVYSCRIGEQVVFQSTPCEQSKQGSASACEKSLSEYEALINTGAPAPSDRACYAQMREQQRRDDASRQREDARQRREEVIAERVKKQLEENIEIETKRQQKIQEAQTQGKYFVEYRVSGSANFASVTIRREGGSEQHRVRVGESWEMTLGEGSFLYLSAQNQDKYGRVTAEIWVNGIQVKTASSTAAYGIATVSGRL